MEEERSTVEAPEAPPGDEEAAAEAWPRPPAVEEQRRGDPLYWRRWKGSLAEITRIFRLADDLVAQATGEKGDNLISQVRVELIGKELSFKETDDFEAALAGLDLGSIRRISMSTGFWTEKVRVSVEFSNYIGASLSVSGKDPFAVSGVEDEMKTALNRGRRWTQVGGRWPGIVSFWAPWVAIAGLALATWSSGPLRSIGFGLLIVAAFMLFTVLFMQYVEPRLVPPLEILDDSESKTISQVWKGRALKALGLAVAALLGALINGLTGFLF